MIGNLNAHDKTRLYFAPNESDIIKGYLQNSALLNDCHLDAFFFYNFLDRRTVKYVNQRSIFPQRDNAASKKARKLQHINDETNIIFIGCEKAGSLSLQIDNATKEIYTGCGVKLLKGASRLHFLDQTNYALKLALQRLKKIEANHPVTIFLPICADNHFVTYVLRIDFQKKSSEIIVINDLFGQHREMLPKISETVKGVFPDFKEPTQDVYHFRQTGGSICGFLSAIAIYFITSSLLRKESSLVELKPEILCVLNYANKNKKKSRNFIASSLQIIINLVNNSILGSYEKIKQGIVKGLPQERDRLDREFFGSVPNIQYAHGNKLSNLKIKESPSIQEQYSRQSLDRKQLKKKLFWIAAFTFPVFFISIPSILIYWYRTKRNLPIQEVTLTDTQLVKLMQNRREARSEKNKQNIDKPLNADKVNSRNNKNSFLIPLDKKKTYFNKYLFCKSHPKQEPKCQDNPVRILSH